MTTFLEPFAPLFQLTREMDRMPGGFSEPRTFLPPADVLVTDEHVTVVLDVPGLRSEELEIELDGDTLFIRGERRFDWEGMQETGGNGGTERRHWQRIERSFGKFERSLRLPKGLDANAIQADLANGVLTVRIAKPEPMRPQRIKIAAQTEHKEIAGTTS